jgi:tRNA-splicing ligase RtcB
MPQNHEIGKLQVISKHYESAMLQIGTLGGGNHFIELQRDEEGILWIMIHSGSRNLGKKVGNHYNKVAAELNERWYSSVPANLNLPFLPVGSQEFTQYWKEMRYCVDFALSNRRLMMQRIQAVLSEALPGIEFEPMINIAHNYAAWENHYGSNVIVHRKGATLASKGVTGIIPGSQGTASYIVEGLGNHESFNSCSHGAGRAMSRTQAENTLSLEEEVRKLDALGIVHGITSQRDLQEASSAYKNIDEVIHNELDLIAVKTRLLPVAVVKG